MSALLDHLQALRKAVQLDADSANRELARLDSQIEQEMAKDGPKCGWCKGPLIRPLPGSDICAVCSANSEAMGGR